MNETRPQIVTTARRGTPTEDLGAEFPGLRACLFGGGHGSV